MGELLDALHRLQEIELQLAGIRQGEEAKARRVQICKRQVRLAEEELVANQAKVRERQMKSDALSLDVAARDQTIEKHRDALSKTKTNKDYTAILTAINTEKADNAKIERDILEFMEEIQGLDDAGTTVEQNLEKRRTSVSEAEAALREYETRTRAGRARLQGEREACASALPPNAVAAFVRVAEHHDGEAMAPVVRIHPKRQEYACSGCNMQVTLEMVSALHSFDDIQYCKVCGRILYFEAKEEVR